MGGKILDYPTKDILNRGRAEGEHNKLVSLVRKKIAKGQTVEQIAEALEETVESIREIIEKLQ